MNGASESGYVGAPVAQSLDAVAVRKELSRILESEYFARSERCRAFLSYVVSQALEGRSDQLTERTIGINVFAKPATYDTGEDAIVRVRANEVRKRLALCYAEQPGPAGVEIHLPAGSYVPDFRSRAGRSRGSEALPHPASTTSRRFLAPKVLAAVLSVSCLPTAIAFMLWPASTETLLEEFWAPILDNAHPVIICLANPTVFGVSGRMKEELTRLGPTASRKPLSLLYSPTPDASTDLYPIPQQYVGIGDAHAVAALCGLFGGWAKPVKMRIGNDLSFAELRGQPTVLLGAFNNRWTMHMTSQLRFRFHTDQSGGWKIDDRQQSDRHWRPPNLRRDGKTSEDFLLVSRVVDPSSQATVMAAAGVTQYGTRAAGEFLTSPDLLREALSQIPDEHRDRNLQFLLSVDIVDETPGRPRLLAIHWW